MAPTVCSDPEQFILPKFSPGDSNIVAVVHRTVEEHRIVLWNSDSQRVKTEFVIEGKTEISCISWGLIDTSSNTDAQNVSKLLLIAAGLANGTIQLFSVQHGALWKHLSCANMSRRITDIVISNTGDVCYSCSEDGTLAEWDLERGILKSHWCSKEGGELSALCLLSGRKHLVAAGNRIDVWNLETRTVEQSFIGHGSKVTQLASLGKEKYLMSVAEGDRFANIWKMGESGKESAYSILHAESPLVALVPNCDPSSRTMFVIASNGYMYGWQDPTKGHKSDTSHARKKSKRQNRMPDSVIQANSSETQSPVSIHAARFVSSSSAVSLLILAGSLLRPCFELANVINPEEQRLVPRLQLELSSTRALPIHGVEDPTQATHVIYREPPASHVERSGTSVNKTTMDELSREDNVVNENEMTIEEKLQKLEMVEDAVSPSSRVKVTPSGRLNLKVDSVHQVLTQALRTNDRQLVEECICIQDAKLIASTVSRLPTTFVIPLLRELVVRFQTRPGRGRSLSKWIRSILLTHMSYLLNHPHLATELAPLYQSVEARLSNFPKLLRLQGRLDVLDQQIRMRKTRMAEHAIDASLLTEPRFTFEAEVEEEVPTSDDESEGYMEDVAEDGNLSVEGDEMEIVGN